MNLGGKLWNEPEHWVFFEQNQCPFVVQLMKPLTPKPCPLSPKMAVIISVENVPFPLIRFPLYETTFTCSRITQNCFFKTTIVTSPASTIWISALLLCPSITKILSSWHGWGCCSPLLSGSFEAESLKVDEVRHSDSFSIHLRAHRMENKFCCMMRPVHYSLFSQVRDQPTAAFIILLLLINWAQNQHISVVHWWN